MDQCAISNLLLLLLLLWQGLYCVLLYIWHINSHSGSGSRFVWKFSFLCNFVNAAHTDMYDTSKESCAQGFHFCFTPKSFKQFIGTLWPKNWKTQTFFLVTESFLYIESCIMPLLKALIMGFISFITPKSFEQFMGTLWPQNWKTQTFFLVTESFLYIESCVMPL